MRGILVAMIVAAGVGLAGTSGAFAAPANGAAISEAAGATIITDQVQRCRCVSRRWDGSCRQRICGRW